MGSNAENERSTFTLTQWLSNHTKRSIQKIEIIRWCHKFERACEVATHAVHGTPRSHESHVSHLTPALVVSIRSVRVLDVVGRLDVELGVIRVMHEELDLALKGRHVLTVHLIGERPEDTLPNETGLAILKSQVVFIVGALRDDTEIEV